MCGFIIITILGIFCVIFFVFLFFLQQKHLALNITTHSNLLFNFFLPILLIILLYKALLCSASCYLNVQTRFGIGGESHGQHLLTSLGFGPLQVVR